MLIQLVLALSLSPAFAADHETMTPVDAERLEQLTKTLEARQHEDDAQTDGAAVILERTVASESAEPVAN